MRHRYRAGERAPAPALAPAAPPPRHNRGVDSSPARSRASAPQQQLGYSIAVHILEAQCVELSAGMHMAILVWLNRSCIVPGNSLI
jgi:hypothetical protein